ncbi:hypothetical protein R0J87_05065 [Halomonas sp. SIMBA_159]
MDEQKELLWRQYQQHIDTYKFYLETTVKLMSLYFVVSGAIVSYYATNSETTNALLALFLLLVMGGALCIFFTICAVQSLTTRKDVFEIRDMLALRVAPETGVLTMLLTVFSLVLLVCSCALAYVVWFGGAL